MNLTPEQQAPIDEVLRGDSQIIMVDGFAGTGKSVIIREIRDQMPSTLLACSSGIAANNIGGVTTFSLFGIPTSFAINPELKDPQYVRRKDKYAKHWNRRNKKSDNPFEPIKHSVIRSAQLLILDECYAIRCDHFDFISKTCAQARKRPHEPFGGLRVLLVGDPGQSLPIAGSHESELKKLAYAFPYDITQSRVLKEYL